MTQMQVLLIHTAQDTADLICKFIKYSSHYDTICGGIKNAFDNIEEIMYHCEECEQCDECDGCKKCEEHKECSNCGGVCGTCSFCGPDFVYATIEIPISFVIFDWKVLFHGISKLQEGVFAKVKLCGCDVIPDNIMFNRDTFWLENEREEYVQYDCPRCERRNYICSSNIIYDDGAVHIESYYKKGEDTIVLSII